MIPRKTGTLIIGATFYGCGLAHALKDAVIVESSIAPGSDYAFAFAQGVNWKKQAVHPAAEEFRRELFLRHAVTDKDDLLTGALVPVFADWCIRHDVRPYFGLDLAEKKGNTATFVDFCGKLITIEADRIIDARYHASNTKLLTAVICSEEPLAVGRHGFFNITSTIAKQIYYLAFEVEADSTMQSARQRLACLWESRPESLRSAQMVWSAMRFSEHNFDNPVAALDAGLSGVLPEETLADTESVDGGEYDVVVCGLGTAGITAAISSGRHQLTTLAIEKSTAPGGVWTTGFIPYPYIQSCTGIAAELQQKAYAREGYFGQSENLKVQLEASAVGKVRIEYQSALCGCEKTGDRVTGVTFRDRSGKLVKVKAKVVIDATAEGVLCNLAGAKMTCGRELDCEFNSYTNTMGKWRPASFGAANFDAGRVAQYDVEDLSNCYLETSRLHLFTDYRELNYCIQSADYPGLREGRHIVTENPWTLKEYFKSGGKCENMIFNVISNLDTHAQDIFFESEEFQDWNIAASCWEIRVSIPVPMQVLFPAGISGVMVPARQLGVDHDLGCAVRMISGLTAIGEVSGIIAAKACEKGILPEQVEYDDIKEEIPAFPEANKAERFPTAKMCELNRAWTALSDEEIIQVLFSENPALGIWNIKQQNKPEIARKVMAENPGTPAAYCSAFALALLGDESVIPVLCDIIDKDDTTLINAVYRYSAPRRTAAVYLLGKLRKSGSANFLVQQLGKRECEKFFAHTVCALLKIGDANPDTRQYIGSVLGALAEDTGWEMIEQLKGQGAAKRRSDGLLRWHIAKHLDAWNIAHDIHAQASKIDFDSHEKWLWKNYSSIG